MADLTIQSIVLGGLTYAASFAVTDVITSTVTSNLPEGALKARDRKFLYALLLVSSAVILSKSLLRQPAPVRYQSRH